MKCASEPSAGTASCALGPDRPELLAGAERAVDHGAVGGAAQLGAHERPALAGLDVLELEDLEDGAADLDVVAVLELVGRDRAVFLETEAFLRSVDENSRSVDHPDGTALACRCPAGMPLAQARSSDRRPLAGRRPHEAARRFGPRRRPVALRR